MSNPIITTASANDRSVVQGRILVSASSAVICKGIVRPHVAERKTVPTFPITFSCFCARMVQRRRCAEATSSPRGTLCLAAWKANSRRQRPALAFYDDISNDIGETV